MVKMAVRENDQIHADAAQATKVRHGGPPAQFWMQTAVNENVKFTDLDERAA